VSILGGEVFILIPYGKGGTFEDPSSWTPKQVAIALLAFERRQKYHTIERKLRLAGPRKRKEDGKIGSASAEPKRPPL
jgi:hypothetical protein